MASKRSWRDETFGVARGDVLSEVVAILGADRYPRSTWRAATAAFVNLRNLDGVEDYKVYLQHLQDFDLRISENSLLERAGAAIAAYGPPSGFGPAPAVDELPPAAQRRTFDRLAEVLSIPEPPERYWQYAVVVLTATNPLGVTDSASYYLQRRTDDSPPDRIIDLVTATLQRRLITNARSGLP